MFMTLPHICVLLSCLRAQEWSYWITGCVYVARNTFSTPLRVTDFLFISQISA